MNQDNIQDNIADPREESNVFSKAGKAGKFGPANIDFSKINISKQEQFAIGATAIGLVAVSVISLLLSKKGKKKSKGKQFKKFASEFAKELQQQLKNSDALKDVAETLKSGKSGAKQTWHKASKKANKMASSINLN